MISGMSEGQLPSWRSSAGRGTYVEGRDDLLWMTYGDLTLHFYAAEHLVVCVVGDAENAPAPTQ